MSQEQKSLYLDQKEKVLTSVLKWNEMKSEFMKLNQ